MSLMALSNNKTYSLYNRFYKYIWIKSNTWNYSIPRKKNSCLPKKIGMKGGWGTWNNLCFCKSCPSPRASELCAAWTLQTSAICFRMFKTAWLHFLCVIYTKVSCLNFFCITFLESDHSHLVLWVGHIKHKFFIILYKLLSLLVWQEC